MQPLTIVGGGVAGLGLAHGLSRRGVPVRVCEAGAYPRHRVCGEFFCGLDAGTVEVLGLEPVMAAATRHRTTRWFRGGDEILRRDLPVEALGLSRFFLDAELARRVREAGGEVRAGERVDAARADGAVVMATGRRVERDSRWIGLKGHYLGLPLAAGLEVHLGRGGYVGLTAVEDGLVNLCGLFPKAAAADTRGMGAVERMIAVLRGCRMGALADRLEDAEPHVESFCACAGFRLGRGRGGAADVPALGDHWAVIPPFTGNGMTMALQAAAEAVPVVERWHAGRMAWSDVAAEIRGRLQARFSRRMGWAGVLHPLITDPTGQRVLAGLARCGVLPFRTLFGLTH